MTFTLSKQGIKPSWENYLGQNIFVVGKSQYEEKSYQFTVPSINNPAGNQTRISLQFPNTMNNYRIDDLYMTWQAVNTSTTLSPTWRNVFLLFDTVKLLLNQVETHYLMDRYQIMSAVQDYLRNYNESEYWNQLSKFRYEVGSAKTCNGESIPLAAGTPVVNGIQYFTLPLTVLFPYLKGMIINRMISQIDVEIVFARNSQSLVNAQYILSNTTSNAYDSNISYNNIRMNLLLTNQTDLRLYKNVYPNTLLLSKWETKVFTQSWTNVVNSNATTGDNLQLDLSSVWGKHTKIIGVLVFIQQASIPAYNNTNACKFFSGASYIGFNVLSNSTVITNLNTTPDLQVQRLRYALEFNKRRYGKELPLALFDPANDINKIYSFETYIDLENIKVDENDEYPVGGISNYVKDIEIALFCTGSINASANIYCMLNYVELGTFDSSNNVVLLK